MIQRREFITLLGGAAAWPLAARAQQRPIPTIGFLAPGNNDSALSLSKRLMEVGYVEGRT
jgi:putative ABC transport system substrate-binding protein